MNHTKQKQQQQHYNKQKELDDTIDLGKTVRLELLTLLVDEVCPFFPDAQHRILFVELFNEKMGVTIGNLSEDSEECLLFEYL